MDELAKKRKAEKARRMLEKSMRMPVNEVILQVQDGVIDLKDFFKAVEAKAKEVKGNG